MAKISVVTSLYGSEPYIQELYDRTLAVLKNLTDDYEFVFVDDGSPDRGNEIVDRLIESDKNVRLIELSRNFGHHKALMVGLAHVTGDLVFMFDSDLEEEPELLETFYAIMDKSPDVDVVYGVMEYRKGPLAERFPGTVFYKLINLMGEFPIPANAMSARLMKRPYVDSVLKYQESQLFLGGIMSLAGFKQVAVPARKLSKGRTTYNWGRKWTLALDALVSFTNKPLTLVGITGLGVFSVSIVVLFYLAIRFLVLDSRVETWMWVLASVWFLGGIIILSIGLVGFYVGRIFLQVKDRPNAIIRKIHN